MTERLYYTDAYLREFDATIVGAEPRDARTLVTLDRTAFYPTSGGQPFDIGTLAGIPVVDVVDSDDGVIAHVVEGPPSLQAGQTVHGAIDWRRRFDHMQQHTGQHVLSAAFDHLFHVRTVSFHLGAAVSTIDLAREMSAAEIAAAESEANRIVWEDRPVAITFADSEEAAQMPLRKEPKRAGRLRLIDVDGFDLSACGGTHVARTGAIGIIAIASWERFKGGQRLEFLCGGRALDKIRLLRDTTAASTRLLSVGPEELAPAVERLQSEAKETKRLTTGLQSELARYRADELAATAEETARGRVVARAIDADANGLKSFATVIAAKPKHIVILISTSAPALVVVARAADVAVQANAVVSALTARFGGRGGGKPELAQAGGLTGSATDILEAARAAVLA
jgi:alanyl-tRNA synthetase